MLNLKANLKSYVHNNVVFQNDSLHNVVSHCGKSMPYFKGSCGFYEFIDSFTKHGRQL